MDAQNATISALVCQQKRNRHSILLSSIDLQGTRVFPQFRLFIIVFFIKCWIQSGADIDGKAAGYTNGFSVSLSANATRVAIGAPAHDGAGSSAGHTRVFEIQSGCWVQLGADIAG
jgi:hypothetical protein